MLKPGELIGRSIEDPEVWAGLSSLPGGLAIHTVEDRTYYIAKGAGVDVSRASQPVLN